MLNLLLYQLRGAPVDEQLMQFLAVDEHLVDIGDDLVDYEVRAAMLCIATESGQVGVILLRRTGSAAVSIDPNPRVLCLLQQTSACGVA